MYKCLYISINYFLTEKPLPTCISLQYILVKIALVQFRDVAINKMIKF